ncbi:MAG: hypothetical protein V1724_02780, partial [Chloroflexota bacterium]
MSTQGYRPVTGAPGGWRARVGVLLPAANSVLEPELYQMAPRGVTFHFARMGRSTKEINVAGLSEYGAQIEPLSELLAAAKVDLFLFGCTVGSMVHGLGFDQDIVGRIQKKTGVAAITTAMAVVEAMRQLGMKKLSVITPYVDEINEKEEEFLHGCGFEVLNLRGLGLLTGGIENVSPFEVYRFGKETLKAEADGLFISCANLRALEIVEALERDVGKPVVAAVPASLWLVLRRLGIRDPI